MSERCPYFVTAVNAEGVHAIMCCDGKRMVAQLVKGECTCDITDHMHHRCDGTGWRGCVYARELSYSPDSLGVTVVSLLRACLQGQPDVGGGAQRDR